jgi:hypothetical protein
VQWQEREHSTCQTCHNTVLTAYRARLPHAYITTIINIIITVTIVIEFIIVVIFGSPKIQY